MQQRITFVSRAVAEALDGNPDWVVISIHEPVEAPGEGNAEWKNQGCGPAVLKPGWHDIFRLEFYDVDGDYAQTPIFDEDMAKAVLAFAEKAVGEGKSILVHCHAGVSRSAAIAMSLGELHELPVFTESLLLSPKYSVYNKHVYRLMHREMHGY